MNKTNTEEQPQIDHKDESAEKKPAKGLKAKSRVKAGGIIITE